MKSLDSSIQVKLTPEEEKVVAKELDPASNLQIHVTPGMEELLVRNTKSTPMDNKEVSSDENS